MKKVKLSKFEETSLREKVNVTRRITLITYINSITHIMEL